MRRPHPLRVATLFGATWSILFIAVSSRSATVLYNNDFPDGLIGTASRPDSGSGERETADDFLLSSSANVTGAAFTGLVPADATVNKVVVEIYRIFPLDSNVGRTSGAPTFSTSQVPTRVNSPSDVAFASRESGSDLQFVATPLQNSFTVANSIVNGISLNGGGEGAVTGQEVRFNISFTDPIGLPADHYFFVPQVQLSSGNFLWLSANRPITAPGTPFAPDLQSWIRNDPGIAPDWLRVGQDIVGSGKAFNGSFLVFGNLTTIPEPDTFAMVVVGLALVGVARRRRSIHRSTNASAV
ncbi:MAG TPA: PEP-CTERM sorting domain-containing protein [Myxococcota bacterium]|nr:PEP-CTERM sorting domain-containing protein [Myxococcota bacterium]